MRNYKNAILCTDMLGRLGFDRFWYVLQKGFIGFV